MGGKPTHYTDVIPAEAGIHIPEATVCGTMGPRFRGDDRTPIARYSLYPPMAQTIFHSCGVTGCTDRRGYFASAMSLSRLSAFTAASVTGLGNGFTASTSTARNTPFSSVGSL